MNSKIVEDAAGILHKAGFITGSQDGLLYFENTNLLGFVGVHETITILLSTWQHQQDSFLRRNAMHLRRDPEKAWNTYSVFLTPDLGGATERASLVDIEEDLRATRKIARAGIITRLHVQNALLPVLPIVNRASEAREPLQQLKTKLDPSENRMFDLLQDPDTDPAIVATWLIEEQ